MCITTSNKPPTSRSAAVGPAKAASPAPAKPSVTGVQPRPIQQKSRCMSDTDLFARVSHLSMDDFPNNNNDDDDYSLGSCNSSDQDNNDGFDDDSLGSIDAGDVPLDDTSELDLSVASTMTRPKHEKTVSFGNLSELSFPVVAGDPNMEMAYPMALGWDCVSESSFSVDDYEADRSLTRRRTSEECRTMSADERRKILKDSKKAFREHQKQVKKQNNVDRRGGLQRNNSIANGMIGRDKRRNRVQAFLGRFSSKSLVSR